MWLVGLLDLALALPPSSGGTIVNGVAFGPRMTLTCTWFSNFENSRFEQCRATGSNLLPSGTGASLSCAGQTCRQLDRAARRVSGWRSPEAPWGTFTVRIVGRIAIDQHLSRHIGDGTSTVLIERVLDVRKSN